MWRADGGQRRGTGPHRRPVGQGAPEADCVHQGCHNIFYFQKLIYGVG
jgi:hypothetical protein